MNGNDLTGSDRKINLASDKMQSSFGKMKRVSIFTSVIMGLFTCFAAGFAIWVATEKSRLYVVDWSVVVYICLMAFCALLFGYMLFREAVLRIPYRRTLHEYVREIYEEHAEIMIGGGKLDFEMTLVGDKLTVFREGCAALVQFDLSPVQNYTGVCAYIRKLAKNYIADYYFVHAKEYGATAVYLSDTVNGKRRNYALLSPGKEKKKGGNFVKWRLV